MTKTYRFLLTTLLGASVFAFWMWLFPQAISYQEQNQLFLFTWDYLGERLSLPGGLADWLSEFLVQFFYWHWAGALILAVLAVLCIVLVGCGGESKDYSADYVGDWKLVEMTADDPNDALGALMFVLAVDAEKCSRN